MRNVDKNLNTAKEQLERGMPDAAALDAHAAYGPGANLKDSNQHLPRARS